VVLFSPKTRKRFSKIFLVVFSTSNCFLYLELRKVCTTSSGLRVILHRRRNLSRMLGDSRNDDRRKRIVGGGVLNSQRLDLGCVVVITIALVMWEI